MNKAKRKAFKAEIYQLNKGMRLRQCFKKTVKLSRVVKVYENIR